MIRYSNGRYIKVESFISFCKDLNVDVSESELEHYEKEGLLFPMARILFPKEYIEARELWALGLAEDLATAERWPELNRLGESRRSTFDDFLGLSDEAVILPFDREIEKNPYLIRPCDHEYRPWNEFSIEVRVNETTSHRATIAEHYYHSLQVHHLFYLKSFPELYANSDIISALTTEQRNRLFRPRSPSHQILSTFRNQLHQFDAVSFWSSLYERESNRAFAQIPESDWMRQLNEEQAAHLRSRIIEHAHSVQVRFNMDLTQLYEFLRFLIDLHIGYERDERFRLAESLKLTILSLAELINSLTGAEWGEIAEELGMISGFWHVRSFRHLDILTKEKDDAKEMLMWSSNEFGREMQKLGIPGGSPLLDSAEIDDLLDFCEEEGLTILASAMSAVTATGDEIRTKFRRTNNYTNLKNLLTSLEYLLKIIANRAGCKLERHTLNHVINEVMRDQAWIAQFKYFSSQGLAIAKAPSEFHSNLLRIINEPRLTASAEAYWARAFLISSLGRNLTVHTFPSDDWFYGQKIGEFVRAAIHSILYSWRTARRSKWV
jgi:hypothetical protein